MTLMMGMAFVVMVCVVCGKIGINFADNDHRACLAGTRMIRFGTQLGGAFTLAWVFAFIFVGTRLSIVYNDLMAGWPFVAVWTLCVLLGWIWIAKASEGGGNP